MKRKFWKRFTITTLIILVLGLTVGGVYVNSLLNSGIPNTNETLELAGVVNTVTITRDEEGIPHIVADNLNDAYFAQGYAQAQDRMFQMDMSRRLASGRLSEVVGEVAVDQDKYYLTLGLQRAAELSMKDYSEDTVALLKSFTDGINAYREKAISDNNLPTEFKVLGYEPEPWLYTDTLLMGKLMAHDLGGNWEAQAFRQYILENFSEEQALELFPTYPDDDTAIVKYDSVNFETVADNVEMPNPENGSNNWVVAGSLTESGEPLVADDPHLSIATPSVWYVNHIKTPDYEVIGSTLAGVPGIILGQNNYGAWGVTNTNPDVQDLYIEKINPDNNNQYLYEGEWVDFEVIEYTLNTKGKEPETFEVYITKHGPVVSDLASEIGKQHVLSLRWTALESTLELESVIEYNQSTDWESFEKALEKFSAPTQNFVYADKKGNIAYKANGLIPIRKGDGLLPVPGWESEYEWTGYIPYNELPRSVNPESGYILSANYKVTDETYPYHISNQWAQPYRHYRIDEVLSQGNDFTVEDMIALQNDTKNLRAQTYIPIYLELMRDIEDQRINEALDILKTWYEKGSYDELDENGALIFNRLTEMLPQVIFSESFDEDTYKLFTGKDNVVDALFYEASLGNESIWLNLNGGAKETLVIALNETLDTLEELQGNDMNTWTWGAYHQVMFKHPLSSNSIMKMIFNGDGPWPSRGSRVTVRAAGFNAETGINNHGSTWRFVSDLSDLTKSYQIVAPGISGHHRSPYYNNQVDKWLAGDLNTMTLNPESDEVVIINPLP